MKYRREIKIENPSAESLFDAPLKLVDGIEAQEIVAKSEGKLTVFINDQVVNHWIEKVDGPTIWLTRIWVTVTMPPKSFVVGELLYG